MKDKQTIKKGKSTKKLRKRAASWTDEDVQVSTSLPPLVEGQLRCYLKMGVNQILWMVPNAPDVTQVKIMWWGEDGPGTIFRPVDVKRGSKSLSRTTARFPIRSGPKQFQAYLNDMGALVLEVLSGTMGVPVGRAQIEHISSLGPSRPINGFFPVLSADAEKVGELQVSIVLESLMSSFESGAGGNSAVPTPDMSTDFYANMEQPINPPAAGVAPMATAPTLLRSHDDPFMSPAAKVKPPPPQAVGVTSGRSTPMGVDAQLYGPPAPNPLRDSYHSYRTASRPSSGHHPTTTTTSYPNNQSAPTPVGVPHTQVSYESEGTLNGIGTLESQVESGVSKPTTPRKRDPLPKMPPLLINTMSTDSRADNSQSASGGDLVSELLDRGHRLKQAMLRSAYDAPGDSVTPDSFAAYNSVFSPLKRDGSSGEVLLREERSETGALSDGEDGRTVDLILGSTVTAQQIQRLCEAGGSPASSVSGGDEDVSDNEDPLHDNSIIEDLFYRHGSEDSDVSMDDDSRLDSRSNSARKRQHHRSNGSLASLEDDGNMRPASRRSSRRSSLSSLGQDLEPTRDNDPLPPRRSRASKKPLKGVDPPPDRPRGKKVIAKALFTNSTAVKKARAQLLAQRSPIKVKKRKFVF